MARGKKSVVKKKRKKPIPRIPQKTSKVKGTFPNPLHPKTGPSVQAIIEALIKTHGMMSKAARILHCDVKTIGNRMREYPKIQEALELAESCRLDQAETMLDRNIGKGNQKAIEFFLKNKGKARGYGNDNDQDKEPDLGTVIEIFEVELAASKAASFPNSSVIEVGPNE
jgi:hypothetical protein